MTNAYVYDAALICEDCAQTVQGADGPYGDGGGEADCPQHCDMCGTFLDNPLTWDGYAYVADAIADGHGNPDVLALWRARYLSECTARLVTTADDIDGVCHAWSHIRAPMRTSVAQHATQGSNPYER